jgi:hypothetical protein
MRNRRCTRVEIWMSDLGCYRQLRTEPAENRFSRFCTGRLVLIRSAWGWEVVGDLRSAGVGVGECRGQRDASAGGRRSGCVGGLQRRLDGHRWSASPAPAATTDVSWLAPSPMVMVWPGRKPKALATGTEVEPAATAASVELAPGVPTDAMVPRSRLLPESMRITWPAWKPSTLATLMLVAPAVEATASVAAD